MAGYGGIAEKDYVSDNRIVEDRYERARQARGEKTASIIASSPRKDLDAASENVKDLRITAKDESKQTSDFAKLSAWYKYNRTDEEKVDASYDNLKGTYHISPVYAVETYKEKVKETLKDEIHKNPDYAKQTVQAVSQLLQDKDTQSIDSENQSSERAKEDQADIRPDQTVEKGEEGENVKDEEHADQTVEKGEEEANFKDEELADQTVEKGEEGANVTHEEQADQTVRSSKESFLSNDNEQTLQSQEMEYESSGDVMLGKEDRGQRLEESKQNSVETENIETAGNDDSYARKVGSLEVRESPGFLESVGDDVIVVAQYMKRAIFGGKKN